MTAETLSERVTRNRARLGYLRPVAPSPVVSAAELIPDVAMSSVRGRSQENVDIDGVLAGVGIVDAYNRWCGKSVADAAGKTEGIMVSCPRPDHPDAHPSAWLNSVKDVWNCAACGEGGDKFDLAAWHFGYAVPGYKGQDFPQLRRDMAESLGYTVPCTPSSPARPGLQVVPPVVAAPTPFQFYTAARLAEIAKQPIEWLVRGMLVEPTYGMVAGPQKSLKSYVGTFIDLSIAAGVDLFGTFRVIQAPVVCFVGEGGQATFGRRLTRIARAIEANLADADLHATTSVAPIGSPSFVEGLQRSLDEYHPKLVHLDPYYAYHGTTTNSSNLHEEGALLTSLSAPCMEVGASLLVTNHFAKGGQGAGLSRITQSGGAEWSDTWILVTKLEEDVINGRFKLLLDIGSRQWGGAMWELDLDLGRYDEEAADWTGDITFSIRRQLATAATSAGKARDTMADIVRAATERPFVMTQEELAKEVGGKSEKARKTIQDAVEQGLLVPRETREGRSRTVTVYGPPNASG